MKNVFLTAMNESFDLTAMLGKINYHHIRGNLTDAEREELTALARDKANPFGGVDVVAKLQDLDSRITALEKGSTDNGSTGETAIPDYVPGKWYYAGDKVMHNGAAYECIAPEGVVCTWNPDEYPAYWQTM